MGVCRGEKTLQRYNVIMSKQYKHNLSAKSVTVRTLQPKKGGSGALIRVDPLHRKAWLKGVELPPLTVTELQVLAWLLELKGKTVTRQFLLGKAWKPGSRSVDMMVSNLRRKGIEIKTVPGEGYYI